jgi:Sigma-70, region 4
MPAGDRVRERRKAAALARHYRDEEGLSIAEIARRLGRAEATVKAYLSTRLMLTKDQRIAPRANASLGATRAAYGAFPDHEVAPGLSLSTAELTPPWPGGTALRLIPAGARPSAGRYMRAYEPRHPGRRAGMARPGRQCRLEAGVYRGPGRSGVPRTRVVSLQGNCWRCRLGALTRRL